jgi:hypothetical protein
MNHSHPKTFDEVIARGFPIKELDALANAHAARVRGRAAPRAARLPRSLAAVAATQRKDQAALSTATASGKSGARTIPSPHRPSAAPTASWTRGPNPTTTCWTLRRWVMARFDVAVSVGAFCALINSSPI